MPIDAHIRPLLVAQNLVISREQALAAGLTRRAIEYRLATRAWQLLIAGVYLASALRPTRSQMQIAALLFAGPESALDDVDACAMAGLTSVSPTAGVVYVVVPAGSAARSRQFVRVRRTAQPFVVFASGPRRCADPATALIAMSRRRLPEDRVLAAFSEAVQRRIVRHEQLADAHALGPPRGSGIAATVLADIGGGAWSVGESHFLRLAKASRVLPALLYNRQLRLPSGRIVVPDALSVSAALVHETNGRRPHEREDLFESMQERHDVMTSAGLAVLHNSPRRIRRAGPAVIAEFETCFLDRDGRGLPPGVELL